MICSCTIAIVVKFDYHPALVIMHLRRKNNVEDGQSCEQFGLSINDKDVFGIGCWFYAILKIGYSSSSGKIAMNEDKSLIIQFTSRSFSKLTSLCQSVSGSSGLLPLTRFQC